MDNIADKFFDIPAQQFLKAGESIVICCGYRFLKKKTKVWSNRKKMPVVQEKFYPLDNRVPEHLRKLGYKTIRNFLRMYGTYLENYHADLFK